MSAPDLTSYRAVHAALRATPHRLAAVARTLDLHDRRRVAALGRYWRGFSGEVLAHHTIEDDHFFPALVARVAGAAALVERTDAEHEQLDTLMDRCTGVVARAGRGATTVRGEMVDAFEALAAHMDHHLDFEDAEILPLFERHFDADAYSVLEDAAIKSLGIGRQAAFSVPYVLASMDATTRAEMIAGAPVALRVLHGLTRGRFARLDATVFGPVAADVPGEVAA